MADAVGRRLRREVEYRSSPTTTFKRSSRGADPVPDDRRGRRSRTHEQGRSEAVLDALDEIVLEELGNAQKVRLGGLVQLTVRVKPATKKRPGRNPATGEEITIAAKPASVEVRARPLAKAKAALPSVQKARRRLAASNGRASP